MKQNTPVLAGVTDLDGLTCERCPHSKVNEHDIFGSKVLTPTCQLSGADKGGLVCPHDWNQEDGLRWKDYRPDWCPLGTVVDS